MEGFNFKIGDVVTSKKYVEEWALGKNNTHFASPIRSISENKEGFFVSNENISGIKESDIVHEHEIKSCAIKFLAARMIQISGL